MNTHRFRWCFVHVALLCAVSLALPAQGALHGEPLSASSEIRAITTALRSISRTERVELNMTRICRTDVTHPDCPGTPKESGFAGHLPGTVWLNVRDQLNADEQMGKQHSSLRNATIVSVQRPVLLGDSIVMLAQVSRPVEGAKREYKPHLRPYP